MTEQASRVFAAEVDVAVIVHVFQVAALATGHRRWKRCIEQNRTRVAAWQHGAGLPMDAVALGPCRGVALSRLRQGAIEIAVALLHEGHRCRSFSIVGPPSGSRCRSFLFGAKRQATAPARAIV